MVRPKLIPAIYASTVGLYWIYIWHQTRPEYYGMDWIGVALLTFPGCGFGALAGVVTSNCMGTAEGLSINTLLLHLVVKWVARVRRNRVGVILIRP